MPASKKFTIAGIIVTGVILLNVLFTKGVRSRGSDYYSNHLQRQVMEPAKTTEEWIRRLKVDFENSHYNSEIIVNLYAELPPKSEWPKLIKSVNELAKDVSQIEKLTGDNSYANQPEMMSQKLLIFGKLLENGDADVEADIRRLIKTGKNYGSLQLTALLMASKDKKATLEWIKNNQPNSLVTSTSSTSYERSLDSDKSAWDAAFADNRIDEGIRLLKHEISIASDRADISSYWVKLLHIGLLTDRTALAVEATEGLKKNLLLHVQSEQYLSSYYYRSLFDLPLRNQEWQSILDTLDQVYAAQKAKKKSLSNGEIIIEWRLWSS